MSEPSMAAKQGDTLVEGPNDPYALLKEVASALDQGRAPRSGRHLQSAARELVNNSDPEGAAQALRLAALLELRRGKPEQAVRPARAAERLVRDIAGSREQDQVLDLLSRIYSQLGEHTQAIRVAERWRACTSTAESTSVRRLALARWASNDVSGAVELLETAEEVSQGEAQIVFALQMAHMLIRIGCPTVAQSRTARLLKEELPASLECGVHEVRGWAGLCLGQPDQASRCFRRAARIAAGQPMPRKEAEVAVALAISDLERAKLQGVDAARLQSRLQRKLGQAHRMGLFHLSTPSGETAPPPTALGALTPKEAAQRLVVLTRTSESLALVDACFAEVERLSGLPNGTRPYGYTQIPPLPLE